MDCFLIATKTTAVLRSLSSIQRVFYDLCKFEEQAMHNFYEYVRFSIKIVCEQWTIYFRLTAGERSKLKQIGRPLVPSNIYPIDLFPHTTHTEVLVKCVRV